MTDNSTVGSSPSIDIKPKRQVKYNPDAVLCVCKKRIRLNNDGRLRIHMAGKMGSARCMGSETLPPVAPAPLSSVSNEAAVDSKTILSSIFEKEDQPKLELFSDQ